MLDAGDLTDRGFTMEEDFALRGVRLVVPPYTKGKKQLSKEKGKQISKIRVHVERVISALKNSYTCKGPLFIMSKDSESIETIDKVVTVCSVLTNFGDPILKCKKK